MPGIGIEPALKCLSVLFCKPQARSLHWIEKAEHVAIECCVEVGGAFELAMFNPFAVETMWWVLIAQDGAGHNNWELLHNNTCKY